MDAAVDVVVSRLAKKDWRGLAAAVDRKLGLTVYYANTEKPHRFSAAGLVKAAASKKALLWMPAWEGDGGMRDPYREPLGSFLDGIGKTDWKKHVTRRYGKSPDVIYRTLFVADLKKKHPKLLFVDLTKVDPTISEMSEFASALMLGFVKSGSGYKLAVIGYDAWKD
jgi:hypothetical protein